MLMRNILWAMFFSFHAHADMIDSVVFNAQKISLDFEITYTGGCLEHNFTLLFDNCQLGPNGKKEIAIRIIDSGWNDTCDTEFHKSLSFDISKLDCRPATAHIFSYGNGAGYSREVEIH